MFNKLQLNYPTLVFAVGSSMTATSIVVLRANNAPSSTVLESATPGTGAAPLISTPNLIVNGDYIDGSGYTSLVFSG